MAKAVLLTQRNLSFMQNAHRNAGYHIPLWLAFTPEAQAASFGLLLLCTCMHYSKTNQLLWFCSIYVYSTYSA